MRSQTQVQKRPLGVTILAVLAGVALVLSVVHLLQALGILPYVLAAGNVKDFNLWYVLVWGLLIWVWAWVVQALWTMDPSAWLFLLVVSGFNMMFDFFNMVAATQATTDLSLSFLVNFAIFAYTLLPSTRRAFGMVTTSALK
jgi:hypothetical protein